VKDGLKVTSTGDVVVGGAVLAGEIEAGGNVTIKGGVICFYSRERLFNVAARRGWIEPDLADIPTG
jgi:uncharacterized protein (DUF342 family)